VRGSSYVARRVGSSNWYYREALPRKLVRLLLARGEKPKAEVWKSLGTPDRKEALRLVASIRANQLRQWDDEIELLGSTGISSSHAVGDVPPRASPDAPFRVPTAAELQFVLYRIGYDLLVKQYDRTMHGLIGKDAEWDEFLNTLGKLTERDNRRLAQSDYKALQPQLEVIANRQHWTLPAGSSERALACEYFTRSVIAARRTAAQRARGNLDFEPTDSLVLSAIAVEKQRVPVGKRLLDLYDDYAAIQFRARNNRNDTLIQGRKMVEVFSSFIGIDRDPETITADDVAAFRDTLAKAPGSFRKRNDCLGKSLVEVGKLGAELGLKPMTLANVNKYLSTISPLFKWAKQSRKLSISNPFDGLHYVVKELENERNPFTADELSRIFRSPLFVGFQCGGKEYLPGDCHADDWRFWIPVICLYTGSRIGEIAQLRIQDVRFEHDIWFFNIVENEKTGQRTKNRTPRVVPVHQRLLDLGFLRFLEDQKRSATNDARQLFAELKPDSRGFLSAEPSRFWRRYLKRIGIKEGADGKGAHTFRHTIADEFRAADYLDEEFGPAIFGHGKTSVTSKYGKIPSTVLQTRNGIIQSVTFSGADFSELLTSRRQFEEERTLTACIPSLERQDIGL